MVLYRCTPGCTLSPGKLSIHLDAIVPEIKTRIDCKKLPRVAAEGHATERLAVGGPMDCIGCKVLLSSCELPS